MAACVEVENLSKRFGSKRAVANLSFEVNRGEVFGILGANGAGKSTTLHMLCGLLRPTHGRITIFGRDLHKKFLEVIPRIGVHVERPAFFEHLTVRQNLLLFARLARKDVTVDRILELVGLRNLAGARARTLSKGLRQRLGLAQAFLTEPELLLLDEPTAGLDPEIALEVLHLLRKLSTESGVTIMFSTHQMHEVEFLCDRVAIMDEGRLVSCQQKDAVISFDQTLVDVLLEAPEAAAKRLREEPWVESVETSPGRLHVRLREPNVHQLTAYLVSAGYKVAGIIPRRRTLREYFLKATNT